MDSNLSYAIVATVSASVPIIVNGVVGYMNKRLKHKAEIEKKRVEQFETNRLNAILDYYSALGKIGDEALTRENMSCFLAAHARLSAFVSPETFSKMEVLLRRFESEYVVSDFDASIEAMQASSDVLRSINFELCKPE